jgi:hypothetical protein
MIPCGNYLLAEPTSEYSASNRLRAVAEATTRVAPAFERRTSCFPTGSNGGTDVPI